MTYSSEITKALKEYANEDATLAEQIGYMSITDTKSGVISIEFEDSMYKVYDKMGNLLHNTNSKSILESYLMTQYQVEE